MKKTKGFTLVELMIVIALVGILAATTLPVGKIWIEIAQVKSAESEIREALGKAKSLAIRNEYAATPLDPVTAVCLSSTNSLQIKARASATVAPSCTTSAGDIIWSAAITDEVSITTPGGNAMSCICFSNNGLLTNGDSCSACLAVNEVLLDSGSRTKTLLVY